MNHFLSQLADKIIEKKECSFENTLVILPNKRAGRVLQRSLSQKLNKTHFSPTIVSINEFVSSLSVYKKLSKDELLLKLYEVYSKFNIKDNDTFDTFLSWGTVFLSDINEIDLQLVDAKEVFINLADIKILETSFGNGELTENQKKYLNFYIFLGKIYEDFVSRLNDDGCAYEGMIFKNIAETLLEMTEQQKNSTIACQKIDAQLQPYQRYIFAGFHAFSASEMEIISYFYREKKAELLFDIDLFYAEQYAHFVKLLQQKLHIEKIDYKEDYKNIPKQIFITGAPKKWSQIYHAIDLLDTIEKEEGNLDNTVLVFADESLVLPFVHAYNSQKANLTMGYPVKATAVYQLLLIFIEMAKNSKRFQKMQNAAHPLIYHRDILSLLQNSLIKNYCFTSLIEAQKSIEKLVAQNRIFFNKLDVIQLPKIELPDIEAEGVLFIDHLASFFKELSTSLDENSGDYFTLHFILQELKNLQQLLENYDAVKKANIDTLQYFINERIGNLSIPFKSNSDHGLQIMGLLETRTLDFKNVIMLSVNEGILPKGKSDVSMILYDIKRHFRLPTHKFKDSIFAYHFFRLLQRAEQVHLIYNNDNTDSLEEKSRFINQLEFEIAKQHLSDTVKINFRNISIPPHIAKQGIDTIEVAKNEEIIEKIKKLKFSPSNLSIYINCPLQFYFSQVEMLEEVENIEENVEHKLIGIAIHHILDTLFQQIKNTPASSREIINHFLNKMENYVISFFNQHEQYKNADLLHGKYYLAIEVIIRYLKSYLFILLEDTETVNLQIIGTEIKLYHELPTADGAIQLKGTIDRVDVNNGCIRILDYKTGKVDHKYLKIKEFSDLFTKSEYKQLFQLLFYAYLYQKDDSENSLLKTAEILAGLVVFQVIAKRNMEYIFYAQLPDNVRKFNSIISSDILDKFEEKLIELIEEILDSNIPFAQTNNFNNCIYCQYNVFCNRG